jgi:hypothetical protein
MVFSFLKKKDYWTQVGGVEGYMAIVKQLGLDYKELNIKTNGYTKLDSMYMGSTGRINTNPQQGDL